MHSVPALADLGPGLRAHDLPPDLREQRLDRHHVAQLVAWNVSPVLMVNQAPAGSRPDYFEHESHGYKTCENLAAALPSLLTFYHHAAGQRWLVTTRAAQQPGLDKLKRPIPGRELQPAHCAEGPTPLAAVLALLTERIDGGQLVAAPRYDCLTQFAPA